MSGPYHIIPETAEGAVVVRFTRRSWNIPLSISGPVIFIQIPIQLAILCTTNTVSKVLTNVRAQRF